MNTNNIYDFKIRAGYDNYNILNFFLQGGLNGDHDIPQTYLPPEVEYIIEKSSPAGFIAAHFFDTHYLCDDDRDQAKAYLHHLLSSAKGIDASKKIIEQKRSEYRREKQEEMKNISFVENDFVVPSSTVRKYGGEQISQKGALLLELAQGFYPVPDFCVLTSKTYFTGVHEKEKHLADAICNLEKMTGAHLGNGKNPLIFAMRSATSFYIPGFLPTYLNAGINDAAYHALKTKYGIVVAGKIYINNLQTLYKVIYPQNVGNEICQPVTSLFSITDIERKINILYEEIKLHHKSKDGIFDLLFVMTCVSLYGA